MLGTMRPSILSSTILTGAALAVWPVAAHQDVALKDLMPKGMVIGGADPSVANPYTNGLPDDVQQRLARRYADVFRVFLNHRDAVTRVTFWGLSDADSWLNRGRMNYPLLWDRQRRPKPAFDAVVEALRNAR
jgi:GH35 family endo-1,4-beta-xylanase